MNLRTLLPFSQRTRLARTRDPLELMHQEINRLFDMRPFENFIPESVKVDVKEDKSGLVVSAELPGVKEEDLSVTMNDGVLTIRGEKKSEKEEKDENYYMMERSFGAFSRSIQLPYEAEVSKSQAEFDNGVLTIRIPRPAQVEQKDKTIKITSKTSKK
jgi:HSP20 family protein